MYSGTEPRHRLPTKYFLLMGITMSFCSLSLYNGPYKIREKCDVLNMGTLSNTENSVNCKIGLQCP